VRRLLFSLALAASFTVGLLAQQAGRGAAAPEPSRPNAGLNGLWDYNEKLSVDAATGQPEQAPLSASQRARSGPDRSTAPPITSSAGPAAGPAAGNTSSWGMGGGTSSTTAAGTAPPIGGGAAGGSVQDFERGVRDMLLTERRDLVRDLLEVPEVLRVRVTDDAVTFVDDLQRMRTYPTSNKLQKYQLGAAQFQARAYWSGGELHKDIEATGDFRMTEIYRLSDSGTQLFVTLRIGDPKKNTTLAGVNRVYDRVAR
jgi:hypothetical protein